MKQKKLRVAPRQRATLGNSKATTASIPEFTPFAFDAQEGFAVRRLAARFGLPPATAAAVALANDWGCAQ